MLIFFKAFIIRYFFYIMDYKVQTYLIWRRVLTAKGAKKNTSPNIIRLKYKQL